MSHLAVIGDLNLDIHANLPAYLPPGHEIRDIIRIQAGGSAGTFARTAARLGESVDFIGAVGDDLVGDLLERSLIEDTVVPYLQRSRSPSGAVLAIQAGDERSMVCSRGANDGIDADAMPESVITGADHLHVSGYALLSDGQRVAAERAFELALSAGLSISVDPPPASLLKSFGAQRFLALLPERTWLFPNQSEGSVLSHETDDEAIIHVLAARAPVGALTLGSGGAVAWRSEERHHQSSVPVGPVDSTGAGDVYAATFVMSYLRMGDLALANRTACSAASDMLAARIANRA